MKETAVVETAGGDVGIIMGSDADWKTMRLAAEALDELGVSYEKRVVSAHRTPDDLFEYAGSAEQRGLALIIAGAGGAAHLPGMTAAKTIVPVVGVPVVATPLGGLDALLSIMQMPAEVGVATVGIGPKGARAAALFAAAALSCTRPPLHARLRALRNIGPASTGTGAPVAILAQQDADLEVLRHAEEYLDRVGVAHRTIVGGVDRVPELEGDGSAVVIAGARQGIDFACDIARTTMLPVLAVPIVDGPVQRLDDFLQPLLELPPGLATFAIGKPGAINAALFAATIVSERQSEVWKMLRQVRRDHAERVGAMRID